MNDNTYFLAGIEHCKKEDFKAAILSFTEAISQAPTHIASYYNRGLAYQKLEKYRDAIQDYDIALTLAPQNAAIYSERGVAKHLLKDNRGAIQDLNEALNLEPKNPYRYASRAYIRAFIGDTEGAIEDYEKALCLDPQDAIALNNLGLLEDKLGKKQNAQAYFKKADEIADKGKNFEKPQLEEILQEYETKQKQRIEAERLLKQPKGTEAGAADENQEKKPSSSEYLKVIKSVFTSKDTFGEFIAFMKYPFKKS